MGKRLSKAFTLIELLVSMAVLLIVMVVLLQLTGGIGDLWRFSAGKISAFQNARAAFATLNHTFSRATLNTYNDYVGTYSGYTGSPVPRTATNASTFVPTKFARASELHFLSGPASVLVPGADPIKNPGSAAFFQAALGGTDDQTPGGLISLNSTLNSTGFYLQWSIVDNNLLPAWLQTFFNKNKHFRLVQFVEPTESLQIYADTATGLYPANPGPGKKNWLNQFQFKTPRPTTLPRVRVLAEDVPLLIFRPRLAPKDEEAVAVSLGGAAYSATTRGSILCPNYQYDSRAWQSDYPTGRVSSVGGTLKPADLMRNQLAPIVDVVMVAVDRRSIARFDQTADTPPTQLQVPATLFTDSSKFEQDIATYGSQLASAKIRYRTFRTSVEVQSAKWSQSQ